MISIEKSALPVLLWYLKFIIFLPTTLFLCYELYSMIKTFSDKIEIDWFNDLTFSSFSYTEYTLLFGLTLSLLLISRKKDIGVNFLFATFIIIIIRLSFILSTIKKTLLFNIALDSEETLYKGYGILIRRVWSEVEVKKFIMDSIIPYKNILPNINTEELTNAIYTKLILFIPHPNISFIKKFSDSILESCYAQYKIEVLEQAKQKLMEAATHSWHDYIPSKKTVLIVGGLLAGGFVIILTVDWFLGDSTWRSGVKGAFKYNAAKFESVDVRLIAHDQAIRILNTTLKRHEDLLKDLIEKGTVTEEAVAQLIDFCRKNVVAPSKFPLGGRRLGSNND